MSEQELGYAQPMAACHVKPIIVTLPLRTINEGQVTRKPWPKYPPDDTALTEAATRSHDSDP
jgi:hypothetical protein